MNKLDIKLGGHPRVADDFNFMLNAINEALTGLSSTLGYNNIKVVVLSGINLINSSGTTWDWTAGFVWIDREIFKVDAGTITLSTGTLEWSVIQTIDSTGTVLYENGNTYDTYLIRRAKLVEVGTPGPYSNSLAMKYSDLIVSIAKDGLANEAWKYIGAVGEPAFLNSWQNASTSIINQVSFRKNKFNQVSIRGLCMNSNFSNSRTTIFTLPIGYRPTHHIEVLPSYSWTQSNHWVLGIDAVTGNVGVIPYGSYTPGTVVTISLDCITFYLD